VFKDFREFIGRGNVIDLAVAVTIGAAFTAIVTSLVDDIVTPILGIFMGGVDFSGLAVTVGEATIAYGSFIQAVINFLIIAIVIFLIIRAINKIQEQYSKQADEEAATSEPPADVKLLEEIRDLLKTQNS